MRVEKNTQRLQSIDALRGLVILIMLLDHVRETFYLHKQVSDPMDIVMTEPALFGSRLLAHLCAPVFVLLTGISAFLFYSKTQSVQQTRTFLFKRGLFLIGLELTLVNFAWTATFPPEVIYLQVIWAIGVSMLALAVGVGGTGAGGMVLAFAEAGPELPTADLTGDLGAAAGREGLEAALAAALGAALTEDVLALSAGLALPCWRPPSCCFPSACARNTAACGAAHGFVQPPPRLAAKTATTAASAGGPAGHPPRLRACRQACAAARDPLGRMKLRNTGNWAL